MNSDERREAVARIVDVNAWALFDQGQTNPVWGDVPRQVSLQRADQILALPDPAIAELVEGVKAAFGEGRASGMSATNLSRGDYVWRMSNAAELVAKYRSTP